MNVKIATKFMLGGIALWIQACSSPSVTYIQVPQPVSVEMSAGQPFVFNERTGFDCQNDELRESARICISEIEKYTGIAFQKALKRQGKNCIILKSNPALPAEGFCLKVNADSIVIEAKDKSGAFYASQSLLHSLLVQEKGAFCMPLVQVKDYPEWGYRGVMLDVSRHFFSVEQVKRFIDLLAMHRLNYFHWHLTDDQGWRIEIRKYPELTRIGAWKGDGDNRYGGFYTQAEIKEVIAYAKERAVTIIPEIDLPGHSMAALAAYPQLGCTGGPYEVAPEVGGVHKDVICLGKEFSWQFAKDVLKEVAALFPSRYIHIGGDEVPRERWKACLHCQKTINKSKLEENGAHSAEDLLQGIFNQQMAVYLKTLGKEMIGWDEVLSDNIDAETVIMSWRGLARGIKALQKGHPVIFSSNGHFYLNNYQTVNMAEEPKATGGLVQMQKVYETNLMTADISEKEQELILGAEACLWTSYVLDNQTLDYMMLPRLAAFAELAWRGDKRWGYADFLERLPVLLDLYMKTGYSCAPHFFEIKADYRPDMQKKCLAVTLTSLEGADIYYTLDGGRPTKKSKKYTTPLYLSESTELRAIAYIPSGLCSDVLEKEINVNKATFADIRLLTRPVDKYSGNDGLVLVDGIRSSAFHTTGLWVGYNPYPLDVILDLGSKQKVKQVCLSSLTDMSSYIMGVESVQIFLSLDGQDFTQVATRSFCAPEAGMEGKRMDVWALDFNETQARYIQVRATGFKALPHGHSGAGESPFVFVDEIEVY